MSSVIVTLSPVRCCTCGVVFGMDDYLDRKRRGDGATFYCSNGHGQHYGSELERLRKQLDSAHARLRHEQDQHGATRRELTATKGHVSRLKTRVANGVCPCCKRSFVQLQRHMATKHPDYKMEVKAER